MSTEALVRQTLYKQRADVAGVLALVTAACSSGVTGGLQTVRARLTKYTGNHDPYKNNSWEKHIFLVYKQLSVK